MRASDHSSPPRSEVKNEWSYNSTPPCLFAMIWSEFESQWAQQFSVLRIVQTCSGAYPVHTGRLFPRRQANHSPQTSAEIKNAWIYHPQEKPCSCPRVADESHARAHVDTGHGTDPSPCTPCSCVSPRHLEVWQGPSVSCTVNTANGNHEPRDTPQM